MTWTRQLAAFAAAIFLAIPVAASAQVKAEAKSPGRDLSGLWTNSSITTLERQDPSLPLALDAAQTEAIEKRRLAMNSAANGPTNPEEGAPAPGGAIGGYNAFWLDRGSQVGRVRGEARSSWITDPANGMRPFSAAGLAYKAEIEAKRRRADVEIDNPEELNPADRCLVGSRGSGGPPMLNNIYNNTYRIVQTQDHVLIEVEMMHDARIIPIGGAHRPQAVHQWLGDSVGRWEGDTLVVETRNWNPQHAGYEPVFLSKDAVVTERFTRLGAEELLYQFEVKDPVFYTQTWTGEMTFGPTGQVFEFACHEGNYAMRNILGGARRQDRGKN